MKEKTESEILFEKFCEINKFPFNKIEEGPAPTPDYIANIKGTEIYIEIKQIDEDSSFGVRDENGIALNSRTVGSHVRKKINEARNQIREPALDGNPAILLIYNNLDPFQFFGTEDHDFLHGMFGENTVLLDIETKEVSKPFYGKNKSFRKNKNQNFSAIGRIRKLIDGVEVRIWENPNAKNKLDFDKLPDCIKWNKVKYEEANPDEN